MQKKNQGLEPENVPAEIDARYHAIGQVPESIDMREVREENLVTYLGTYAVPGAYPLQFSIAMEADGATVKMNFDDQSPKL